MSHACSHSPRFQPGRWALAGMGWLLVCLQACAPALNWREVRFEQSQLAGWLPCKPDRAQRDVNLNGHIAPLRLMGCEAEGMDFTLAQLDLPAGMTASQMQPAWQAANLASVQAVGEVPAQPWTLTGAAPDMTPRRALAQGGQGLTARWAWFAYDGRLYQAAVYAPAKQSAKAELAMDTLLSGLRLP